MRQPTARAAAVAAIELTEAGELLQAALDRTLANSRLSAQEKNFCADLVYGYFRQGPRLDFILRAHLKKPDKLPKKFRIILSLAIYSLLFQDGAPHYAILNEAARMIKGEFGRVLTNVANGVLRNVQRDLPAISQPDWYAARGAGTALMQGLPQAVADLWTQAYGPDAAEKLLRRSASRPYAGVRLNRASPEFSSLARRLEAMAEAGQCEKITDFAYAFAPGRCPEDLLARSPGSYYARGALSFQAAGSCLILERLGILAWPGPVWDCCAGAGGKSLPLLEQGRHLLAADPSAARLRVLSAACSRLRLPQPAITAASALAPPLKNWAANIIVDAPCSGLGVLARRPDLRKNLGDLEGYPQIQLEILKSALRYLRPGRELAYITCTLNPAENENLVEKILAMDPALRLKTAWQTPHDHPWLEGMYGAVLTRS